MDWIDRLITEKAAIHMKEFNLSKFKVDYPSLYNTIVACLVATLK